MLKTAPVYTIENECQDCYKCVRHCHCKAIRIDNGKASVITENCVACGECVKVCPSHAKKIRSELPRLRQMLGSEKKLYASIAPSFTAFFPGTTIGQLAAALKKGDILMAMGNSDVPVGQYTQKILAYYELSEEELANAGVISYGSNVKEVTTQVSEGSVDCGVIYCTDAFSAGLTVKDSAAAEMCGQVIYPAAILNVSENQELAKDFLAFIQTDACMEIFEEVGFSRVQ